jgi:lipid-A-disaccharide synthase
MKLYFISGEASGDLHASNLVRELVQRNPQLQLRGWGGDLMQGAGVNIVKHYRELAFMGFTEVLLNLRTIMRNFKACKADIEAYQPDALVLIDYPGFNLRMAKWAHARGIKVYYYISPTIWAWKENRVHTIKECVTKMYCVLPFEPAFYAKHDYQADFFGHPLLDEVEKFKALPVSDFLSKNNLDERPIIALLPGSRKQEISTKLPLMLEAMKHFPDYQFVVAGAPGQEPEYYNQFVQTHQVKVIFMQTYQLLSAAKAGMVTSGTATLEAGLFKLPQVVCYIANPISYHIAKRLVNIKYISLVNLILGKEAVVELIQKDLTTERLVHEMKLLLEPGARREAMVSDYEKLHEILGGPGCSARIADSMLKSLQ